MLAQGRHPSVDAVPVELGNTGSKTTIHKYLKELEAEEGSIDSRTVSISDALQDVRLQEEAIARHIAQQQVADPRGNRHRRCFAKTVKWAGGCEVLNTLL